MIDVETLRAFALSLPEAKEEPHFDKTSFRVNKKIFATIDIKQNRACVKLSEINQDVFSAHDRSAIYAIPNKWGKMGWTYINLELVSEEMCTGAIIASYCEVAPKKLSLEVEKLYK